MAVTIKEVIYLGTFADADTDESTATVENTGIYQQTFGSAGSPLSNSIESMTFDDADNNTSIETDNQATSDTTDGNGGVSVLDSLAVVNVTVTYADNSTATYGNVVMFQTANGELFLSNSGYAGTDLRDPGGESIQSITVNSVTSTNWSSLLHLEFQSFACFVSGSRIATPSGPRAIEGLKAGDLVETMDHGAQPIRWIGQSTVLGLGSLASVRIKRGALGGGLPLRDLSVSQQHRMLMRSPIAARMTGQADVLVAAKALEPLNGIDIVQDAAPVTYVHMLFDQHEIIMAEGAATESLLPRAQALALLGADNTKAALQAVGSNSFEAYGGPARMILSGHKRRQAIARHAKNNKPIWQRSIEVNRLAQRISAA